MWNFHHFFLKNLLIKMVCFNRQLFENEEEGFIVLNDTDTNGSDDGDFLILRSLEIHLF